MLFAVGTLIVLYVMFAWWRDTMREAHEGHHTRVVSLHLRYGMLLFIASEVMFFVAWFWAYFDAALFAGEAISLRVRGNRGHLAAGRHPDLRSLAPAAAQHADPAASGTTVTWAHHALLHNDREGLKWGLTLTVVLGVLFTIVQAYEYSHAAFGFSGSSTVRPSTWRPASTGSTSIVGTIFLLSA
jgi:cytochrome c oxidase subunit 3